MGTTARPLVARVGSLEEDRLQAVTSRLAQEKRTAARTAREEQERRACRARRESWVELPGPSGPICPVTCLEAQRLRRVLLSLSLLDLARADRILDTDSTPSRHLRTTEMTERGTRRRGRHPCPARQSLATAAEACLAANQGALPCSSSTKHDPDIFVMRRTPSKSPRMSSYTAPPRKSAYRQEIEEDAPPVASLNEFESGDYAGSQMDSGCVTIVLPRDYLPDWKSLTQVRVSGRSRLAASHDPTASPFAAASAPLPSHSTSNSKEGYSVYVFGFPAAATDLVLDFFTQFGEIVSTTPSTEGGNWVTITYAQAWSAARAARKNGEILGGALMIGVKAVDEDGLRRALAGAEGGQDLVPSAPSATPGPRQNGNAGGGATSTPSGVGRPVNVLGPQSAFKAAPTPTRKGFLGLGGGGGATAPSTPGGADPHASLFAEKSKQAALAQQPQQKGVLGKVSDMVFGW